MRTNLTMAVLLFLNRQTNYPPFPKARIPEFVREDRASRSAMNKAKRAALISRITVTEGSPGCGRPSLPRQPQSIDAGVACNAESDPANRLKQPAKVTLQIAAFELLLQVTRIDLE
jgi:hypothetical protein